MDYVVLLLAATATAVATGLGAIPVILLGRRAEALRPLLWGATVGMMVVASFAGLILPAIDEGTPAEVVVGIAAGISFLLVSRKLLFGRNAPRGAWGGAGKRTSVLVFSVLFVHSLPEGFAIGSAYASDQAGLSLFIIVAIALHNIPEGTSVAVPMSMAGFGPWQQFWAAVLSSAPQVPGALVAYLLVETVDGILPLSFSFAAGAMLGLVVVELIPATIASGRHDRGLIGAVAGAALMLGLALLFKP